MGVPFLGQEHVDRYRETDGQEGHDWQRITVLLLTPPDADRDRRADLAAVASARAER